MVCVCHQLWLTIQVYDFFISHDWRWPHWLLRCGRKTPLVKGVPQKYLQVKLYVSTRGQAVTVLTFCRWDCCVPIPKSLSWMVCLLCARLPRSCTALLPHSVASPERSESLLRAAWWRPRMRNRSSSSPWAWSSKRTMARETTPPVPRTRTFSSWRSTLRND